MNGRVLAVVVGATAVLVVFSTLPATAMLFASDDGAIAAVERLRTADERKGNHVFAYTIFFVLAGMGLMLVFRGIRAR